MINAKTSVVSHLLIFCDVYIHTYENTILLAIFITLLVKWVGGLSTQSV